MDTDLLFGSSSPTLSACFDSRKTAHMTQSQSRDPLHGITLERIVTELVEHYGWSELGQRIDIRCFQHEPSIKSSLKFLRRTPWARTKVESLYVITKNSPWAKKSSPDE